MARASETQSPQDPWRDIIVTIIIIIIIIVITISSIISSIVSGSIISFRNLDQGDPEIPIDTLTYIISYYIILY